MKKHVVSRSFQVDAFRSSRVVVLLILTALLLTISIVTTYRAFSFQQSTRYNMTTGDVFGSSSLLVQGTYQPSINDQFTFNFSKRFTHDAEILVSVYNESEIPSSLLYHSRFIIHSQGVLNGLLNVTVLSVTPASSSEKYGSASLYYQGNLSFEWLSSFEQYIYLPPPFSTWYLQNTFTTTNRSFIEVHEVTSVAYNDSYFFLGGYGNGSILVGSGSIDLDFVRNFVRDFVGDNDTVTPVNSSMFIIPINWSRYQDQGLYIINEREWLLNTTVFETRIVYQVNDSSPALQPLVSQYEWMLRALVNASDVNITASIGNVMIEVSINGTYDNVTGHVVSAGQSLINQWDGPRVNGTAIDGNSTISFNSTQSSRTTCESSIILVGHEVLYQPSDSSITTTTSETATTTVLTETTTTEATDVISNETSTSQLPESSANGRDSSSIFQDNQSVTQTVEKNTSELLSGSLATIGFGLNVFLVTMFLAVMMLVVLRKKTDFRFKK